MLNRRLLPTMGLIAVVLLCMTPLAGAAPTVTITNVTITGTTGFFDVHLSNPGGSDAIGGYTVSFQVTHPTGTGDLAFSSVSQATSPTLNGAPSMGTGNTDFYTVNGENTPFGSTITGGDNTNLFQSNFSIPNGTTGTFDVTFLTVNGNGVPASGLFNGAGANVATATFSTTPGIIAVPEPGLIAVPLAVGLLLIRRRSIRA